MNKTFIEGVMIGNKKWIMDIERDTVVFLRPQFCSGSKRLLWQTKKALCELEQVSGAFKLIAGEGLVRK